MPKITIADLTRDLEKSREDYRKATHVIAELKQKVVEHERLVADAKEMVRDRDLRLARQDGYIERMKEEIDGPKSINKLVPSDMYPQVSRRRED